MSPRRRPARVLALALSALTLALAAGAPPALAAARPGLSFTQVQQKFMCTVCHEALPIARSPEAYQENAVLRGLIARGDTAHQIVRTMEAQYGSAVLAKPPAHGFSLLVYLVPGVVVLVGLASAIIVLPRWRRQGHAPADVSAGTPVPAAAALSADDARRLDAELARSD